MNNDEFDLKEIEQNLELMKVIEKLEEEIVLLRKTQEEREIAISQLSFHLENSPLAFIEWDKRGIAKSWSKRAEEIFGWTAAEFIGKNGFRYVYRDDLPRVFKEIRELVTLKTRRNHIQHRNITKDGRIIWCEWFNSVTVDKQGEVVTMMSLVRDITDLKRNEELKEYEQIEKEALINATDDMMWSVGKDYKLIAANKAFIQGIEAMAGITLKPGDSTLIKLFPEDMLSFWEKSYSRVLAGETLKEEVYTPPSDLYKEFWRETSFEPIYHDDAVIGVACHSRDITERKLNDREKEQKAAELVIANQELLFQNLEKEKRAAELIIANKELAFQNDEKEKRAAELILANEELLFQNEEKEKRAAELVIANKELAFQNEEKEKRAAELIKANKELTAFTYVSSHDLQEPLRKIQTLASHLLAREIQNLSEKGKNYFCLLQDSARQMRTLITDLLTFSHLNTEESQFQNTDLKMIIEEVAAEFQETIDEKHGHIEIKELSCASIIPFQFRQLLRNLIGNAIKYSNPLIPLLIRIESKVIQSQQSSNKSLLHDIDYCRLTVTDNGIGFDPEYNDRIFEVFQKLHGKEEYAGSGIGLAIVKKIVDNHNGIITATGRLGHGAAFDIYLPIMLK